MKFCNICDNMLYISITSDNKLQHYCKNCSYKNVLDDQTTELVSTTTIDQDVETYKQFMTKYIKYDMSLPRVNNISCVNPSCKTNSNNSAHIHDNQVIYIKYDQTNMRYLYYCCHCEQFWKNEAS